MVNLAGGLCLCGWMLAVVGCGEADSPESVVVSPPGPTGDVGGATEVEEPGAPGGLELPAGGDELEMPSGNGGLELPTGGSLPNGEGATGGAGGIEMPANVEIPESSSSQSTANPSIVGNLPI